MEEYKLKIHEILNDYLKEYIPSQEITHAANEICKTVNVDGTYSEAKVSEMHSYLKEFDKEFIPLQTVRTSALTHNQIILAIHYVKTYLADYAASYVPIP